jgi:hypothetical protein
MMREKGESGQKKRPVEVSEKTYLSSIPEVSTKSKQHRYILMDVCILFALT